MKRIIEIRGAEGGQDSKLFAKDLAQAYIKLIFQLGWKHRLLEDTDSIIKIEVEGENLVELQKESGGHRIQRVPPTERNGRVHTSTVTVAVTNPKEIKRIEFNERDFDVQWYSGTGNGGQNRNKVQNCCRIIHRPSGLIATAQCRSREQSLQEAKNALLTRLSHQERVSTSAELSRCRLLMMGSGQRGDKIRTYRFQDDSVKDHRSEKSARVSDVLDGKFHLLW